MPEYVPPNPGSTAFTCPHCEVLAGQRPQPLFYKGTTPGGGYAYTEFDAINLRHCWNCQEYSLFWSGQFVYPVATSFAPPNNDLPDDIKADYVEAGSIASISPRGAAALLRLCIQKLCHYLDCTSSKLDDAIAELVKAGMPRLLIQAMDVVRVTGNNAVHPGELDIRDNVEIAATLAGLVNIVAEYGITAPKRIDKLYDALPDGAKAAAEKRNARALES